MAKPPPPHVNPFASKKKPGVTQGAIARRAKSKHGKPKHKLSKDKVKKVEAETKKMAFDPKTFFKNKH